MTKPQPSTGQEPLILVVEDERQMVRFLRTCLSAHGYRLAEATTAAEGLALATSRRPDVILMDLELPDLDGVELTRRLREWMRTPILVISARHQDEDKVNALDAGADDYLTKPFSVVELLARIRVALRRAADQASGSQKPLFRLDDLRVDFAKRQVFVGDKEIHLTPTEYALLSTLIRYAGRVVTHHQLLKEVWGPTQVHNTQYLRVFVGQLRQKLERDPARPQHLINEPGVGYRLRVS